MVRFAKWRAEGALNASLSVELRWSRVSFLSLHIKHTGRNDVKQIYISFPALKSPATRSAASG